MMVWCANCTRHQRAQSASSSLICCHGCGKVVIQEIGSKELALPKVGVAKHEKAVSGLNAGKSLKFDVAKLKALQRACKTSEGAMRRDSHDGSESLSDIDDAEVRQYLLKEDEKLYKKMIWERMNEEYVKAQAARKAAAANAVKLRKEKQQRKAAEAKNARDTAKTTDHMLPNKRTSSKVNYSVLEEFLGEQVASDKAKKIRTDSDSEGNAISNKIDYNVNKFNDWGVIDEDDERNSEKYQCGPYHDYEEEQFYDDDDYFF